MKVYILNYQFNKIGGGWSFADNLAQGLGSNLTSIQSADVCLIAGATMVDRKDVEDARSLGKKIVLRIDNHLLPSRNRNSGMQKLKEFAQIADLIIYQSHWAHNYLNGIIQPPTDTPKEVILNGVDLDLFEPLNQDNDKYLYARSSRIAEKGWEMARYWYSRNHSNYDELAIIGKFSSENMDYNFDFFNSEPYRFYGQLNRQSFANMLGQHRNFLYSYFMDACSNTLIEALACGCQIIDIYGMLKTGGAPEIMEAYNGYGRDFLSLHRMTKQYLNEFEKL